MPKDYDNYIGSHFGYVHQDDYVLMGKYFRKNYRDFICATSDRILDVGCGMGHFLFFLKELGCNNVTGIDVSQECINFCLRTKLGTAKNLQVIDLVSYLSKGKAGFDLIVMNDIIEHLPKDEIVKNLKIARGGLAEDGKLVVKVVNSANPITGAASRYVDFTHTVGFTEESLAQVLRLAGFSCVEIRAQDIWVFNPVVNAIGKSCQSLLNGLFRLLTLLYGRRSTKIFTKDIIAVANG